MFDPTAYENFKVILEGSIYEHDFTGDIKVIDRSETIDLSILSRCFSMTFVKIGQEKVKGRVILHSSLADLADEILEQDRMLPGAFIDIHFLYGSKEQETPKGLKQIRDCLLEVWGKERQVVITERRSFDGDTFSPYEYCAQLSFNRKISEGQSEDLYDLITYCMKSLDRIYRSIKA
ncbi:hypothetical protein [Bacillus sp. 1P06AnD]|uniref:hypothetical protein n=1 Tax=Bacillus sp. 1P06AnD TaxID=3132208 RepID=UPI0039A18FDB